eukprot:CAMPEP_0114337116 /NCGR_PEP_ID=MMETSP0101-20121206/6157_1 /TAXON_ID=38822 ORGANISM="Pteridomonas danica, Strain PT" /NCGR_SAMPLE_ID=MMETSP0101 /ASSEMBLY_ACC=CAM_ASM_000211 /LENGTH=66 /DNA_ID=CAMNT_0001469261 /DNA_START=116 /DNA_END=316 /DNA_ORIENTATION=+
MDAFTRAVEALANEPIKGVVPSIDEIARVKAAADSLNQETGRVDASTGRLLPSQEEINKIVEAMKR